MRTDCDRTHASYRSYVAVNGTGFQGIYHKLPPLEPMLSMLFLLCTAAAAVSGLHLSHGAHTRPTFHRAVQPRVPAPLLNEENRRLTEGELRRARQSMEDVLLSPSSTRAAEEQGEHGMPCELLANMYTVAAGGLLWLAVPGTSESLVLGSTALAMILDAGPAAARDLDRSIRASIRSVERVVEASPKIMLVDNFVHNLAEEDSQANAEKELALTELEASNRWSMFVRGRILSDLVGTALMLRGFGSLGAAAMLACRALLWMGGAGEARMDARLRPSPLSLEVRRLVGGATATLAAAALLAGIGWNPRVRALSAQIFSSIMLMVTALRRLVAWAQPGPEGSWNDGENASGAAGP
jgi:hypothetical protein